MTDTAASTNPAIHIPDASVEQSDIMTACGYCGHDPAGTAGSCPPEPPVGTWVKDRHGGSTMRHRGGGWAPMGCEPYGVWNQMWAARGPLVVCGPFGADR